MNEIREILEKALDQGMGLEAMHREHPKEYNDNEVIRRYTNYTDINTTAIKALIKEKADGLRLEHYGVLKNRIYRAALTALLKELGIE